MPRLPFVLAAAALSAGCASYPERTAEAFRAFQGGHFADAEARYMDLDTTDSPFLAGAEAGLVSLTAGEWEGALSHLHDAGRAVSDLEQRALVSASSLGEGLSSWAINDTALPYRGEGFERVYLHACLAMAYLAQGRLDDVWVEVRLADQLLEAEQDLYEKEYRAGGLGHFISATAYEILGRWDEAYIDYQRMAEKEVGTQIAGRALVRISNELGWEQDAARWEERFGADIPRPDEAASIVVIGGVGTGPFKVEGKLVVGTDDGLLTLAVPSYVERSQPVEALRLRLGSGETVLTDLLEDVSDVARENLDDRLAWMAAKSAARGLLKRELTKNMEKNWDETGRFLGDLFALASERADLRGWQTLPASWQASRMFIPPGVHELRLEAVGGEDIDLGAFELEPGETMVIFARTLGARLYAHAIGGVPVAVADA